MLYSIPTIVWILKEYKLTHIVYGMDIEGVPVDPHSIRYGY